MNGIIQYTIRPYDTIWMLAQIFNTTVDSIMDLNPGIDPKNLQIGQVISIMPGFQYYPVRPETPSGIPRPGMPGAPMMPGDMERPRIPEDGNNAGRQPRAGMPEGPVMPGRPVTPGMPSTPGMPGTPVMPGTPGMPSTPGVPVMPGTPSMPTIPEMNNIDNLECDDYVDILNTMQMLWTEHMIWTNEVINSMINDLPESNLFVERLQDNAEDFSDAFSDFYAQETAQALQNLLLENVSIFVELVSAVMAGNNEAVSTIEDNLYDNAEQISSFLASINPVWLESEWDTMLFEYVELISQYLQALLNQNYDLAIGLLERMISQVFDMAEEMAEGIYVNIM